MRIKKAAHKVEKRHPEFISGFYLIENQLEAETSSA